MSKTTEERSAGIEYLLLDYTQRLARNPVGRRAIIIHLSRLRADNRRDHHVRIAASTFEALVKNFDGHIFVLQNADIVFVYRGVRAAPIDDAIGKLRYLFGDDPLSAVLDEHGPDDFATWYDLERDLQKFRIIVEGYYEDAERRKKRLATLTGDGARDERRAMDPHALGELVNALAQADLSNMLRRQAICTLASDEPPQPIFREVYISIPDLRDTVMPRRDITSDPWLFQYLTQLLDKRVLALLRRNDDQAIAHSYSLNLNVSTLLSPEFMAFDQSLRANARGTIVIELQKVDVFADLGSYIFARDFLKERGYRICLDGVTTLTLPFVDRDRLGLDLVKIFWTPDMADTHRSERTADFQAALEACGKTRVVLARCDSDEAVQFGIGAGLRLFQGRHVDRLLNLAGGAALNRRSPVGLKAAVAP